MRSHLPPCIRPPQGPRVSAPRRRVLTQHLGFYLPPSLGSPRLSIPPTTSARSLAPSSRLRPALHSPPANARFPQTWCGILRESPGGPCSISDCAQALQARLASPFCTHNIPIHPPPAQQQGASRGQAEMQTQSRGRPGQPPSGGIAGGSCARRLGSWPSYAARTAFVSHACGRGPSEAPTRAGTPIRGPTNGTTGSWGTWSARARAKASACCTEAPGRVSPRARLRKEQGS